MSRGELLVSPHEPAVEAVEDSDSAGGGARKVALPDPDEFVELMDRVRKKKS